MRLFFSIWSFAFTIILALIAFGYTAIYYPTTMRYLLASAQHMRDQVSMLDLPDSTMVWVDIFLDGKQIVLVGFSIAVRIIIALIQVLFGGASAPRSNLSASSAPPASRKGSPFSRWG